MRGPRYFRFCAGPSCCVIERSTRAQKFCRKWTEVGDEAGGSPVNWPQTRSNARSFLDHFLTPLGPVYSI